jgi:hypothetical protein
MNISMGHSLTFLVNISENVPLKSEIFTKNVKEWPIEMFMFVYVY